MDALRWREEKMRWLLPCPKAHFPEKMWAGAERWGLFALRAVVRPSLLHGEWGQSSPSSSLSPPPHSLWSSSCQSGQLTLKTVQIAPVRPHPQSPVRAPRPPPAARDPLIKGCSQAINLQHHWWEQNTKKCSLASECRFASEVSETRQKVRH